MRLIEKEKRAIEMIRNAEKLALRMDERGFHVAFSGGKDEVLLSPIFRWTDADVWNFIRGNNMDYCELYDQGRHRLGCLFCHMQTPKGRQEDLKRNCNSER